MIYIISTAYGDRYVCDKDGYVLEYSNGLRKQPNSDSRKTWQITGAWYNIGFGHVRYCSLEMLTKRNDLRLCNGTPRFGLTDIDHGTPRLHGNKDVHGIASIRIEQQQ